MYRYNLILIKVFKIKTNSETLSTFIRFEGCNLRCEWCDTAYSWDAGEDKELLSADEIYAYIKQMGGNHITLTGGEPLMQKDIGILLSLLAKDESLLVYIETNGYIPITPFKVAYGEERSHYIVVPGSGMTHKMSLQNLNEVTKEDVYKFVIASKKDLELSYEIIKDYSLDKRCKVYLSPVADKINPQEIVEFMKEKNLVDIKLQLQLHKIIWPKECRGV